MRTFNTYFTSEKKLENFLHVNKIIDSNSILIQIFISSNSKNIIQNTINSIKKFLPSVKIIGSTTNGEILNGEISTGKTALSITKFEKTTLRTHLKRRIHKAQSVGANLVSKLVNEKTKVIITFTDSQYTNGENYLNSINLIAPHVIIAGGMAGHNAQSKETFVFTQDEITNNGAVGVALDNQSLHVHTDYNFNWKAIGKKLTITKAIDNRVFTIDDKTAYETYAYYLGDKIAKQLPDISVEFPLILFRNNIETARTVLSKNDDGSLMFSANLKKGDQVQIGFGNEQMILNESYKIVKNMEAKAIESIFIYSCMARRKFMPISISSETLPLQNIAPTSGFFTHGEFYNRGNKELLNQTMTILALSESNKLVKIKNSELPKTSTQKDTIEALFHIINITTDELIQTNNRLTLAVDGSQDGLWEWDIQSKSIYLSPRWKEILGYKDNEFIATIPNWRKTLHPKDEKDIYYHIGLCIQKKLKNFKKVYRLKHKEGHWVWVLIKAKIFFDKKNDTSKMSGFMTDITDLRNAEKEIEKQKTELYHQAYYDSLTGLPNRTLFLDRLKQAIRKARRTSTKVAVLFIDLDDFKKINDSMGHQAGDETLIKISNVLLRSIRDSDTLSRLGGDEFILLIDEIHEIDMIADIATKLLQINSKALNIKGQELYVTNSIGISIYPDDGSTADMLLKNADAAMYKAKDKGKNTYQFYKKDMTEKAYERLIMETSLRLAIKNDELEVYYQPQVDTLTEKILGMEALVRWNHPSMGILQPNKFIPLAQESNLIIDLDKWVMKTAMKQIVQWHNENLNPGYVSLNLTIKQLEKSDFISFLKKTLEETKCPASLVELEVVESQIMKNTTESIKILKQIKELGIQISLDDFGTGYSSLSYLKELPISKIKIDQSFVRNLTVNESDVAIVKAIISIATNLNLSTIAEGVETREQRNFLLQNRCDKIQGYFYSKPIPAKTMKQFLSSN